MAWYNDYRPTNFEEVIGQNMVKTVLQNALSQNKIKHGYLLSGPKGVGKTTIARIFANDLNDLIANPQSSMDIIELDAASNSGVDNIRQLIDSAQTPPFAGKFKIFIIDEVHMLSKSAMNALLKILEEPPTYLVFLLATTNPEKLLPTVLSRLTKLALTSHSIEDIVAQLKMISTKEKLIIDEESLVLIAKRSSGGQRDAINLLETLSSYELEKYTIKESSNLLGFVSSEIFDRVSDILLTQNFTGIKTIIQELENIGLDGEGFLAQFLDYLLESVFENPSETQSLILPVASILDMKLPINTIHSSFALIQVEITKNNLPKLLSNPKLTEKKTEFLVEIKSEEPKADLHSELNPESPTSELVEPNDNNSEEKAVIDVNNSFPKGSKSQTLGDSITPSNEELAPEKPQTSISESEFKKLLAEILSLKTCPPPLKIVSNDINIESIEDDKLKLSISSPIFLPQVKNEKIIKFIQDFVYSKTQNSYSIEVSLRDPSLKNPPLEKIPETRQEQNLVVELERKNELAQPKVSKEKIFYKIYGDSMPENNISDKSNLKFFTETIPHPESKVLDTHSESWNNEIGNIFDF